MPTVLSPAAVAQFAVDGFLKIDALTTANDLEHIRAILDPLFATFDRLPSSQAVDLAGSGDKKRTPEINRPSALAPALKKTETYARCRAAAQALLGAPVGYVFDHAIYKMAHNEAPTHWHQDEAYTGRPVPLRTVHFWIPLQEATLQNGCMWFIPGSHQHGMIEHHEVVTRPGGGVLATTPTSLDTATACELAPGGVTVHHPLTLHYTAPNQTNQCRRAWIVHFGAYGRLGTLHPANIAAKLRNMLS